jgi:SAM-dependent methyltransferase
MQPNSTVKDQSAQVWTASPAGTMYADGAVPGTQQFFANVLQKRSTYELPWLFELVPFAQFRQKKVLELGCGAGFDAYAFCQQGADYTGIDLTPENPARTQTHLGFYGLVPKVLVGDAELLMFADQQFDVAFSNGVLHHTPDIRKSFQETWRVLKHGGEFWVILYHKHSIFYWINLWLVDHLLYGGFLKRTFQQRLSMIEYTTSNALPLVNVYSRQELADRLTETGFQVESTWVRKLVKEDLPYLPVVHRFYRYLPQPWLDFIAKAFGWYLIAKARKL